MPKVSVIIPIFGVEKYIERCARSLFEQTLDDIEYLFIDDCTLDRSIEVLRKVLEEYPQRMPQVKIHRMEFNSGQAKVREWGMRNATGDYVIHCDSDDWVDTDMYRAMYEKARDDDADVIVCDYYVHDGEKVINKYKGSRTEDKKFFITNLLLQKIHWSLWNKMFKRDICLEELNYPTGNMGEDLVLTAQMALKCSKFTYLDRSYYFYFVNSNSITKTITSDSLLRNFNSTKVNAEIVIDTFKDYNWDIMDTCLLFTKYNAVTLLFPVFHLKKYRELCHTTFPHLYRHIIFDVHFPMKHKLIFTAAYLGLYPHKIKM